MIQDQSKKDRLNLRSTKSNKEEDSIGKSGFFDKNSWLNLVRLAKFHNHLGPCLQNVIQKLHEVIHIFLGLPWSLGKNVASSSHPSNLQAMDSLTKTMCDLLACSRLFTFSLTLLLRHPLHRTNQNQWNLKTPLQSTKLIYFKIICKYPIYLLYHLFYFCPNR